MLCANLGRVDEVGYDANQQPVTFARGELYPEAIVRRMWVKPPMTSVGTLAEILRGNPKACVRFFRRGGLGDVCMLIPVVRALQQQFPVVRFEIDTLWANLVEADPTLRMRKLPVTHRVILNDLLELDHTGDPEFSHRTRIETYARAMGAHIELPVSWDLQLDDDDDRVAEDLVQMSAQKTIAVQLKGHAPHRSLGPRLIGPLVDSLRALGRLVLLDDDKGFGPTGPDIVNLAGKTTPRQAIAVLKRCDAALTMESGVFWLAHLAKIPTVCFFGPTRPSERLMHHPLYPKRVKAVVMNELLNPICPPCWGNGSHCDAWGRKVARCMNEPDPNTVTRLVTESLQSVME